MAEELQIRLANIDDMKNVFDLSNDDTVRKNSINQNKIEWEDHVKWFRNRIDKSHFYIVENKNKEFVAQVRFDEQLESTISISITKNFRGKGLASKIIKQCSKKSKLKNIVALVKKENLASQKSFLKAGYKYDSSENDYIKYRWENTTVYIIAEMSANHCGDIKLAKEIIKSAKDCGVSAIKIQTYTADTMTINHTAPEFRIADKNSLWYGENLYSLYQNAYTPWEWQAELKTYADQIGIDFFSTPFDFSAVDFLESINVPCYKIASFEAIDYPLIKYAAKFKKPMIISTGISSIKEIQEAVDACKSVGNNDITLLKCTSAYPAKLEDMNIITIKDMIETFSPQGVKIGLSDHSMSNIPAITAVALGACVVEKHFTLDRNLGGADAGFSLEPNELKSLVQAIRDTEKTLGKIDYTINENNRKFARSLYAVKDIKKGEIFTHQNVRSIRPSNGLHPRYYETLLGKKASCDINFGTPLSDNLIDETC